MTTTPSDPNVEPDQIDPTGPPEPDQGPDGLPEPHDPGPEGS